MITIVLVLFGESCLEASEIERGLHAVDKGLQQIERSNERWMEDEFHRLRGELLLASTPSRVDDAHVALSSALQVAKSQGARSFELRALESLLRFNAGRADEAEARTTLAACYGEFVEGLDTADLRRVKVLLDSSRAVAS